jgi:hypothetical protein
MTSSQPSLTSAYPRTPRAAAFAGIIFSVLWVAVLGLIRLSVPSEFFSVWSMLSKNARSVADFAIGGVFGLFLAERWSLIGKHRDRPGKLLTQSPDRLPLVGGPSRRSAIVLRFCTMAAR